MSEGSELDDSHDDASPATRIDAMDPATDGVPPGQQDDSGSGSVRVVGTAHVSEASAREVETAIRTDQPDVVAVELDEDRYRQMQGGTPDDLEPADLLKGNTVFQFLAYWMLSYVQTRLGERFDVEPGADMLAAIETAEELGVDVALVDRDIQTTVRRFWQRLSLLEKFRMLGGLAFGVTDPRIAGITFGLVIGVVLGPVLGLFGEPIGVTTAVLVRAATAAVAVAVGGYVAGKLAQATGTDPLLAGVLVGSGTGVFVAVTGAGTTVVASVFPPLLTGLVGSLAIGATVGLLVGIAVGAVIGATGLGLAGEADDQPLDEFDPDELTDTDAVTAMMEEFRAFSPGGAAALIDERDAYIAHGLLALRAAGNDVVAVVGAGHKAGIEEYLANPERLPPMASLTGESDGRGVPWGKIIGVVLSVGFVAFFVLLAVAGVRQGFLLRLFAAWFLINGVFAAGLAKLAGARWRSAGVGGAVAWMTSINPLLAPGWFTGYMELRYQRVNIADITTLNELLSDEERPLGDIVSEMFDVPLFRLIVVVAATNVGSIIASVLFATYVLPLFGAEIGGVEGVSRLMIEGARESARFIWGAVA